LANVIGFAYGEKRTHRQAIFAEQVSRRVGYVEHNQRGIWLCDAEGKHIARVLRYKPHQAPQPSVNACGAFYAPPDYR